MQCLVVWKARVLYNFTSEWLNEFNNSLVYNIGNIQGIIFLIQERHKLQSGAPVHLLRRLMTSERLRFMVADITIYIYICIFIYWYSHIYTIIYHNPILWIYCILYTIYHLLFSIWYMVYKIDFIYTYIHTYMHTYKYIYIYVPPYMYIYVRIYIYI